MKKLIYLIALIFVFGACDDGFEEMNVNPTKTTQLEPKHKLTYTQLTTLGTAGYQYLFCNLIYIQPVAQYMVAYNDGVYYTENDGRTSQMFNNSYPSSVKTAVDLVVQLEDMEGPVSEVDLAIAKVYKVLVFSRLTDVYGDIPYSEAGLGYIDGIRYPSYDKQEDIYADLLIQLEEAANVLKNGGLSSYGTGDLFFNGDVTKWNKFTNSLMLRLALRMVKVDPSAAQSWATKAVNGGVMESNQDMAYIKYDNTLEKWGIEGNPLIQSISTRNNRTVKMISTFVDAMKNTGDPRLSVWCSNVEGSTDPEDQLGLPPGTAVSDIAGLDNNQDDDPDNNTDVNSYSLPNIAVFGTAADNSHYNQPFILQSYAEVEFMLAEVAKLWQIGGEAKGHYEAGVEAAMEQLSIYDGAAPITDSQISEYLAANPYGDENGLELIGNQYWLAAFPNAVEGWQNWKRTGYPDLVPVNSDKGVTGGEIPRRLPYTNAEKLNNTDNVNDAASQMGGDLLTTRMWWDK